MKLWYGNNSKKTHIINGAIFLSKFFLPDRCGQALVFEYNLFKRPLGHLMPWIQCPKGEVYI